MKKKIIVRSIMLVIVVAMLIGGYYFFKPVPIITNKDQCKVDLVQITDPESESGALMYIENYNENEIIEYLSTCMERRTLEKARSYQQDQVSIEIMLQTDYVTKVIMLGEINEISFGYGKLKHTILNADEVKSNMLKILDLE